jgi:hypothetical protein
MQPKNCNPLHCSNFCGEIFPFECLNFCSHETIEPTSDICCLSFLYSPKVEREEEKPFFED